MKSHLNLFFKSPKYNKVQACHALFEFDGRPANTRHVLGSSDGLISVEAECASLRHHQWHGHTELFEQRRIRKDVCFGRVHVENKMNILFDFLISQNKNINANKIIKVWSNDGRLLLLHWTTGHCAWHLCMYLSLYFRFSFILLIIYLWFKIKKVNNLEYIS